MAITQAMCTSFKKELMTATHNFATNGNSFKLALYAIGSGGKSSTTATLGAASTVYVTTGEVASSGTYVTGGLALTKVAPTSSGTTATDPMIYRRSFSSSTKAKISLERLLMRMDAEPYELVNVTVGKGWEVQRALRRENGLKPCHSSLNSESAEGELS